ncbi:hypothetical protein AVEN_69235-1 [Araneus ventricosus]|uniref:Uncharacterized protein n=1 Tax=Araneus ventricosus TaxID=182803 RepID=A0A4Y2ESV3_ARAVE|nr:hypothetical protein AVEN_69235-1 [Araneus ventricosus]
MRQMISFFVLPFTFHPQVFVNLILKTWKEASTAPGVEQGSLQNRIYEKQNAEARSSWQVNFISTSPPRTLWGSFVVSKLTNFIPACNRDVPLPGVCLN